MWPRPTGPNPSFMRSHLSRSPATICFLPYGAERRRHAADRPRGPVSRRPRRVSASCPTARRTSRSRSALAREPRADRQRLARVLLPQLGWIAPDVRAWRIQQCRLGRRQYRLGLGSSGQHGWAPARAPSGPGVKRPQHPGLPRIGAPGRITERCGIFMSIERRPVVFGGGRGSPWSAARKNHPARVPIGEATLAAQ